MTSPTKRPLEEEGLFVALRSLAEVAAIAWSLRQSLAEPLTPEDIEMGAQELTSEQIMEDLKQMEHKLAAFAMLHLKASPDEWSDAVLSVP